MALKLVGMGLKRYAADNFNRFDAVVVVTSIIEIIVTPPSFSCSSAGSSAGSIAVMRTFRLLRVLKLMTKLQRLQYLVIMIIRVLRHLTSLTTHFSCLMYYSHVSS